VSSSDVSLEFSPFTGNKPNNLAALKIPLKSELAGLIGFKMVTLEVADSTSTDLLDFWIL